MKAILQILIFAVYSSVLFANTDIPKATVTLPYSELVELLERANASESQQTVEIPKPPVDVMMQSAIYTIDCTDEDAVTLHADFNVVNLSKDWQSVPLVEASEAIRSLEPADARVVEMNGSMSLLLEPMQTASVTIGLQAEHSMQSRNGLLIAEFLAMGAARSVLDIKHSYDPSVLVVKGTVGGNQQKSEFSLPASGGPVEVKLYEPEAVKPTAWSATATHWIRDHGGEMEVDCHVRLNPTDGGTTTSAELLLASPAHLISVSNSGNGSRPLTAVEMTTTGPVLHLNWPDEGAINREVIIKYTTPLEMVDARLSIPLVQVSDAARMNLSCYVSEFEGIEASPVDGRWLEAGRLPDWIGQSTRQEKLHYFTLSNRKSLELSVRMLPRLKTASATIERATYFTELVVDGGMLHKAEINIDHSEEAGYVFKLPEGGKLLSCSVDGRSTEPFLQEDNELLINLPKPGSNTSITKVAYVFTTSGPKMRPVEGKAEIELPRTPLFLHDLSWEVQLPSEYEATAIEGNVAIVSGGSSGERVRLSKQIFDNETPIASLFYTRRDLENSINQQQ